MTTINATRIGPSGRVTGSASLIIERAGGQLYVGLGLVTVKLDAAQQAQLAAALGFLQPDDTP
jgi:hypothetical protein